MTAVEATDRSLLARDLALVAVAVVGVQLAFWERRDLPGHLVAGAGAGLLFSCLAPRRWERWMGPLSVVVVLTMAIAFEVFEPGIVDLGDAAFTAAGALLVSRSTRSVVVGNRPGRLVALLVGAVAVGAGFVLRYG